MTLVLPCEKLCPHCGAVLRMTDILSLGGGEFSPWSDGWRGLPEPQEERIRCLTCRMSLWGRECRTAPYGTPMPDASGWEPLPLDELWLEFLELEDELGQAAPDVRGNGMDGYDRLDPSSLAGDARTAFERRGTIALVLLWQFNHPWRRGAEPATVGLERLATVREPASAETARKRLRVLRALAQAHWHAAVADDSAALACCEWLREGGLTMPAWKLLDREFGGDWLSDIAQQHRTLVQCGVWQPVPRLGRSWRKRGRDDVPPRPTDAGAA